MHDLLSEPRKARFASFFMTNHNHNELQGVYRWHQAVSSSFLAILNDFEVVLRNVIHFSISNHYDTQANDSFDWMGVTIIEAGNSPNNIKHRLGGRRKSSQQQGYSYTGTLGKIEDAIKQLERDRKSVSVDAVVAELSFGFWPTVLSDLKKQYRDQSREQILRDMFPHAASHDTQFIDHISKLLKQIRLFRNRCGHHDSLLSFPEIDFNGNKGFYPRKPRHTINSLKMLLERIRLILGWVDDTIIERLSNSDHWHRLEQLLCKDMLGYYRYNAGNANTFIDGLNYKAKVKKAKLIKARNKRSNPKYPAPRAKIESYYV